MNYNDEHCECENQRDEVREKMIMKIRELDFAIVELGLYLDTQPDDQRALCLHREYTKELKELKDKYQKIYGPLSIFYPCNKWRWLEEPWGWKQKRNSLHKTKIKITKTHEIVDIKRKN